MTEEKKKESGVISRREFLKDAGLVVGGAAIGSTVLLAACGGETETVTNTATKTVTTTAPGGTATVTTTKTEAGGTATTTVTQSKYVCPVDGQEFDSLSALQAHYEAAHSGGGDALNLVSFTVNGEQQTLQVEPYETLRETLRDKLGILSVKDMCVGVGACGSCTVIMDGRPILSCMTLSCECDGVVIETSEGIAKAKHPLIEAYIKHYCMQCGYCTPGFICTAKALLDHNPNPTEEDIREALAGNLCRCATYIQHIPAVLEAAEAL